MLPMLKPIVLLLFTSKVHASIQNQEQLNASITSLIISQFSGYNFIFHYDNSTRLSVDPIIQRTLNVTYFVLNYHRKPGTNKLLQRPPGYMFMHVIMLEDYKLFQKYTSSHDFNLEHVDVVMFVVNQRDGSDGEFQLWEGDTLSQAGTVFVLNTKDVSMYTICFFCGELSRILQKIVGLYNSDNGLVMPFMEDYINYFKNFNGHVFNVACTMYRPFFWCIKRNKICETLHGTEGHLLALLSAKLNFHPNIVDFSGTEDAWAAMISSVREHRVHWAVGGITVTVKRNQVVDFTDPIRPEPYTAIYSVYEDIWMSWQNILVPFDMALWLLVLGTVVVIGTVMWSTVRFTGASGTLQYLFYIQGCFRFLVEQGFPTFPEVLKTRLTTVWLMFLWWMMALIITNAYKSKLTSSLINFKVDEPSSVDELVQRGFRFQTNKEDSSVLRENLASAADPSFATALKRSKSNLDLCPSIMATMGHKIAVIEEETTLQYEVLTNCRQAMTADQLQALRLINDELFPSTHAWPMQLSSPYRQRFSRLISRLHAAGMFSKWYRDSLTAGGQLIPKSHHSTAAQAEIKFSLVTVLGPILIWMLGALMALACFAGEVMWHKRKGRGDGIEMKDK